MTEWDEDIEVLRLAKLKSFAILDTPHEDEFDTVVAIARRLLDCPIATISLVDDHRQWFKASCGLAVSETPRDQAFCAHAMHVEDIMVIEDATLDPRFADNPAVTGPLGIRFYAGVPLRPASPDFDDDLPGIGTLCVIDTKPRKLTAEGADSLRNLAALVGTLIRARASASAALRLSVEARNHAAIIARKQRQLLQAERMAEIGSWRMDLETQAIEWSEQVFAIHGLPVGEVPSYERALSFFKPADRAMIANNMAAGSRGEAFDYECDFVATDGRVRRVRSMGEPEVMEGRPVAMVGVFQDVTDRFTREQSLRYSADTDALTGLPNRGCFEARLADALARATQAGDPLALLILDLDGFKSVNDSFGHGAGDEVLRVIADRMRGPRFTNTFSARLGGDEFVMLIERPRDCAEVTNFVSHVLAEVRYEVERHGESRFVSATVGGARFEAHVQSSGDLLRKADIALYEAKRHERGTGRIFGESAIIRAPVNTGVQIVRQQSAA